MSTLVGPNAPGTVTGNTGSGFIAWSNATTTRLAANDSSYATCGLSAAGSNDITKDLVGSAFGLTVPADALLLALYGNLERKSSGTATRGTATLDAGVTGSQVLRNDSIDIPTADSSVQLGGSSSFSSWTGTPTVADANSSSTRITFNAFNNAAASRTISVDYYNLNALYDIVSFGPSDDRSRLGRRGRASMGVLLRCWQSSAPGGIGRTIRVLGRIPIFEMTRGERLHVYRTMPAAFV